ncbi:MAG: MBG domain-containing protein, partial [Verrucomicrobia bacterium]|nr:MBG domain-containing protein [Verrucomicrobiota bacterium]
QGVTFTPTDTLNYQIVTTSVSVTVSKPSATVTLGKLAATYDGKTKSVSVTTNPPRLTVKLTYNGSTTAPKNAGSYAVVATIVAANQTGSTSGTLVIAKATPSITRKPIAKAIVYGQTLASSTLSSGAASVGGTFAFTTPTTVPVAGTASQGVTFTPTDTLNYQIVTTSVNVTVSKATPLITTQPTATAITYGQTLASSTLGGGTASVPGACSGRRHGLSRRDFHPNRHGQLPDRHHHRHRERDGHPSHSPVDCAEID